MRRDVYSNLCNNMSSTDIEAEVTEVAPTKGPTSDIGNQDDDGHDHRWPTRSPLPPDYGDSMPYPNRTKPSGNEDEEPDHRWPTRSPITPEAPYVQSSSSPDLDQTDDEHDNRWPTGATITESNSQETASPSDYDFDTWVPGLPQIQGTEEPFYYDYYNYYDDTRADSRLEQSKQNNPWMRRRMSSRSLK